MLTCCVAAGPSLLRTQSNRGANPRPFERKADESRTNKKERLFLPRSFIERHNVEDCTVELLIPQSLLGVAQIADSSGMQVSPQDYIEPEPAGTIHTLIHLIHLLNIEYWLSAVSAGASGLAATRDVWFFTVVGASELRAPTKLHIYCDKLQNPRCYNCLSDGVAGPLCDLLDDSERKEWLEPERFKLVIFLPLVVARLVVSGALDGFAIPSPFDAKFRMPEWFITSIHPQLRQEFDESVGADVWPAIDWTAERPFSMLDCQDMANTARGMMVASCTRSNYQDMASWISRLQCFVDREAAFDLASSLNHVTKVY